MLTPFFVWQNKMLKSINPEDVICLFAEGNYTKIILSNKSYYMVRSSLSAALKKLPPGMFVKIHRAFAVSIYFADNIARDHLTINGQSLPIGRQYYKSVIEQLNVIE